MAPISAKTKAILALPTTMSAREVAEKVGTSVNNVHRVRALGREGGSKKAAAKTTAKAPRVAKRAPATNGGAQHERAIRQAVIELGAAAVHRIVDETKAKLAQLVG